MVRRVFFKKATERNVYEAALERVRILYDRFDKIVVSFSGGKDSTVCLNLCLQIAKERKRLPLDVYFWDEEAIQPETVEYVNRVRQRKDVRFRWLCIPIRHRNACSRQQPYWHPWNPDEKELWVRPMPEYPEVETTMRGFRWGDTIPDIAHKVYGPEHGKIADVRGLRADESIRRYRAVCAKLEDNWIGGPRDKYNYPVSPIYDWNTLDVWTAPREFGWDHNRAYEMMTMAGMALNQQRVCPPFGEEPLGNLWVYADCWPKLWNKMIHRVPGAATAGRYASSELYGYGRFELPKGFTWERYAHELIKLYPKDIRPTLEESLERIVRGHFAKVERKITEERPDLITGLSWKLIANIMHRGDLKGRRAEMLINKATMLRDSKNISMEEALAATADEGTRY